MPQVQPSQVYAVAYNSTALNVTWAAMDLNREKIRGKLIGYRVSMSDVFYYSLSYALKFKYQTY